MRQLSSTDHGTVSLWNSSGSDPHQGSSETKLRHHKPGSKGAPHLRNEINCLNSAAFESNDWRHKLASLGYLRATLLITIFCVLISAPVRIVLFVWLWKEHGGHLLREMLVSSAVPAVIVPVAVYWFMRLLYDLEAARAELLQVATTDSVTQIHNRNYFWARLNAEVTRTQREHIPLSLILIDLDHFKSINDGQGHTAGDFVLYDVAQTIRCLVRPYDVVARYGGDEFVLLMPGIAIRDACTIAERIRDAVSSLSVPCGESVLNITVSIGIACCADTEDERSLIERTDAALYKAKRDGRNRWACATISASCADSACAFHPAISDWAE